MKEITVYLNDNSNISELQEEYGLTETEAKKLKDLIYEVALKVNLDTGKIEVNK